MLFREYIESDAEIILTWIKNEREFRLWSADRYDSYPISAKQINDNYKSSKENSLFYPMTLEDNKKIVGHLILRNPSNEDSKVVRLGFIIVDVSLRGRGYGKKLINEAIKFAKGNLNATKITLGVFENNDAALRCYTSSGFKIVSREDNVFTFNDEKWNILEMEL